jgi:hypothetical protein
VPGIDWFTGSEIQHVLSGTERKEMHDDEVKDWDVFIHERNKRINFDCPVHHHLEPDGRCECKPMVKIPTADELTEQEKKIKEIADAILAKNQEVRTVDPLTGGEKGAKLQRFSLIPPEFLWELATHYGKGALKYADRNWEKGYKWSLSLDALERHLTAMKMGEWLDPETGTPHIICVAWHAIALFIFHRRKLGTNDIYKE